MFETTDFEGLVIFNPKVFPDNRGSFFESYNQNTFLSSGIKDTFVQDNESFSTYGTLRGLHMQRGEMAQAKLVRVLHGEVLDVAVDLREGSNTFGKYFSLILSAANKKQLYIPRGFAHGFVVLSESAQFFYKCDNFYSKAHEIGIKYNDKNLGIDWKLSEEHLIVSDKDKVLPSFTEIMSLK